MSIDSLSDVELRAKIANYGYPVGPVTESTRKIYVNKLRELAAVRTGGRNIVQNPSVVNNNNAACASQRNLEISPILLFFDLEMSGLELDCDVLQIAVKSGESSFSRYIDPVQEISLEASRVNNLYNRNGALYRNKEKLETHPARIVLEDLLEFLSSFGKPCVMVAHNCPFDAKRLVRLMIQESMHTTFAKVIEGFTDTLKLFGEKYPERKWKKGCLTLSTLVQETLGLSTEGAHDAAFDTAMLEKLALHHFSEESLLNSRTSFKAELKKHRMVKKKTSVI